MLLSRRVVSALTATALTCGLSLTLVGPAQAQTAQERCSAANAVVTAATAEHKAALASLGKSKAKTKAVSAKVKRAKAAEAAARVAVLKQRLAKAKAAKQAAAAKAAATATRLKNAQERVPWACSRQTGDPLTPTQLGALMAVFEDAGAEGSFLPEHVIDLVALLFPDELDALTGGQLATLLAALNSLDLAQLQDLAGLVAGFGDLLSPAQVSTLIATITSLFAGLPDGQLSATQMAGLIGLLQGQLAAQLDMFGLGAVGDVLQLLLTALGSGELPDLDLAGLMSVLDELLPGITSHLSPSQLTGLLSLVTAGGLDPTTLLGLLGDSFSPEELLELLTATADPALLQSLIAELLPQLGAIGGVPGTGNPSSILSGLTSLLDDLLGGVVCTLLPFLCP